VYTYIHDIRLCVYDICIYRDSHTQNSAAAAVKCRLDNSRLVLATRPLRTAGTGVCVRAREYAVVCVRVLRVHMFVYAWVCVHMNVCACNYVGIYI